MKKYNKKKHNRYLLKEHLIVNNPLVAFTCLAPMATPGFLYNTYQIARNKFKAKGKERAISLICDDPTTEWQNLALGVKGLTAQFFTKQGVPVDYKHNATSEDLQKVLTDETYQHVVLQGHGSRNSWCARDGTIYTDDINEWMQGLPMKNGYFIQFTCGSQEGEPLGSNVIVDPSKNLGYTREVHFGDIFDSLWNGKIHGLEALSQI